MIRTALAALVTVLAASSLFAQNPDARSAQTGRSSPTPTLALESLTGRDSFDRYCASCHGADGRGGGPVASALKSRPTDLTTLARRNGGTFPRERVASFVEGTERLSLTHGSGDMPVWGRVLRGLESSDARISVRLANLVAYVESLQLAAEQAAPARTAEPMSGAQLFRTHCASCHGENAGGCRTDQRAAAERRTGSDDVQRAQRRHVPGGARAADDRRPRSSGPRRSLDAGLGRRVPPAECRRRRGDADRRDRDLSSVYPAAAHGVATRRSFAPLQWSPERIGVDD